VSFTHLIHPPKIPVRMGRLVVDSHTFCLQELKKLRKQAYDARRYKERKAQAIARAAAWREANKEKFDASVRKWQDKNRDKVNELKRGWYWRHREEINAKKRARAAAKRAVKP